MKWWIFKGINLIVIGCIMGVSVCAQDRHEQMIERYKRGWNKLIPRYSKIQFAGSMGLLSLGVGWDYGKKKQWETDLFLGYLPKFAGKEGHMTITLKENYIPWEIKLPKNRWVLEPFTASLYINKIWGDEFWTKEPDKYPTKYYNVATNLRFNLAFGQRIQFNFKPFGLSRHIDFFYEFSTNDLYIISYFTNKYLHLGDIFNLSLGLKFQFL